MSATKKIDPGPRLSNFDVTVLIVGSGLVGAILLTILLGDRVGVRIARIAPQGEASSTARIAIQFNEAMNWETVTPRISLDPPLEGDVSWSGTTLRFRPASALTPGAQYTVNLQEGAESVDGRKLLEEVRFTFTVRSARVAYLAPSDGVPQNVWIADPADPASAAQITFSSSGVSTYDVSPDGTRLAFAERNTATGGSDMKLIDLESGVLQQITNCPDSDCDSPVWRPDGGIIAYHRTDFNSGLTDVGVGVTRVWLIDLSTTPPSTRPLFPDSQILGYSPIWSADGNRIAVFDNSRGGILVYDFRDGSTAFIATRSGGSDISISPDGASVVYPNLIIENNMARSHLQLADLTTNQISDLSSPAEPLDDATTAWSPDGRSLAIARRYLDDRFTLGKQLYLMNVDDRTVRPLVIDERYFSGYFSWDPQGERLVIQRFPQLTEDGQTNNDGRPEIWTYDVQSNTLVLVASNAYLPDWVP